MFLYKKKSMDLEFGSWILGLKKKLSITTTQKANFCHNVAIK
jgi:hypothetical protein